MLITLFDSLAPTCKGESCHLENERRYGKAFEVIYLHVLKKKKKKLKKEVGRKERGERICSEIVLTWADATVAAASSGCVRNWDTTGVTCSMMQL